MTAVFNFFLKINFMSFKMLYFDLNPITSWISDSDQGTTTTQTGRVVVRVFLIPGDISRIFTEIDHYYPKLPGF